jgi:hypothetical protein
MAGLDPAIHLLRKDSCEDGWMRGSSPRMTRQKHHVPVSDSPLRVFESPIPLDKIYFALTNR